MVEFIIQQWLYVSLLIIFIVLYFRHESVQGGTQLTTTQLTQAMNKRSAVLIDVRDKSDYEAGHIANAIHVKHEELMKSDKKIAKYKDKPIILVDKMGQHTGSAGKTLRQLGYDVSRLRGGVSEWQHQQLPLVKG